ncbi:MAG: type II secretion system protein [Armatimonadota bacterium]
MNSRCRNNGLTLVEVLVVIAIIVLAAALVVPAFVSTRSTALRSPCIAHLRQYGLALQIYEETVEGRKMRFPSTDDLISFGVFDAKLAMCPVDPVGGYASKFDSCRGRAPRFTTSYETLSRFGRDSTFLSKLNDADPNHGVAACRLHGHKTASYNQGMRGFCLWAWHMFEGPLLRLRKDGSVQTAMLELQTPVGMPGAGSRFSLWSLFTDEPEPEWSSVTPQ